MSKPLVWSQSSISLNRTMDDSLDLLFCQNSKKTGVFKQDVIKEKSIKGLIKFLKEKW